MPSHFAAIILAAGYSSRMGCFKPALPLGKSTIVERVISIFQENGIEDIIIVGGNRYDELTSILKNKPVQLVENQNFSSGMFSSVITGVKQIKPEINAFFIMPVDIPLVRPFTIRYLMSLFNKNSRNIIHPCFCGERGHPPMIVNSQSICNEMVEFRNLKAFLEAHDHMAINSEVPDRNILFDMDTPDDYNEVLMRLKNYEVPTQSECEIILTKIHPVSDHVLRHCRMVSYAAYKIGEYLIKSGVPIDIELIRSGAILHDIAKGQKEHAHAGQKLLADMGFAATGKIVSCHTDLQISEDAEITEAEVVYIADKHIKGDEFLSIEQRYQHAIDRFSDNPEAIKNIFIRRENAQNIKKRLERRLERTLESILKEVLDDIPYPPRTC